MHQRKIIVKERLRPGKMLLVDTVQGRVIGDEELKEMYADRQPYGEWLDSNLIELKESENSESVSTDLQTRGCLRDFRKHLVILMRNVETSIKNMALNGGEGTAAMGIDIPLAVLSDKHQNLFNYFKQLFAQVTNPPIDAIREEVVTSTTVYIGADGNLLEEKAENCKMLKVNNPILTNVDLLKIKNMKQDGFKIAEIPTIYYKNSSLEKAMDYLFIEVDRAIRDGANILILSDRGVDEYHVAMPSLLALSGLQQHLVRTKKRTSVAIILETGEPREVHHFATLLGYGACAVNPYLAHETIRQLIDTGMLQKDYYAAVDDYNHGILQRHCKNCF